MPTETTCSLFLFVCRWIARRDNTRDDRLAVAHNICGDDDSWLQGNLRGSSGFGGQLASHAISLALRPTIGDGRHQRQRPHQEVQ